MRRLFLVLLAICASVPAAAEADYDAGVEAVAVRLVQPVAATDELQAIAAYGPFRVLDEGTAALVDVTDESSPAEFSAMLRDYPTIATLRFVDCPGTYDDRANLALGRMIRSAGLAAEVPEGGSVRSGAVELVLAGVTRQIDDAAEFAVHAWLDEEGREASDYSSDSPENAKYLAYYREMGLADPKAFYAMTNSVSFEHARWLDGAEMRGWLGEAAPDPSAPQMAYLDPTLLDFETALN